MTSVTEAKESKSTAMVRMYNVKDYYQILEKVGRGTYGSVFKVKNLKDGRYYAIKKLENNDTKLQQEGFPITALRGTSVIVPEISLLKQIDHPNIIKLKEIIVSRPNKRNLQRGSTFLVFEYMDHDFAGIFKMKIKYSLPEIKSLLKQLLEGVAYLHRNKILHRDIKSANILLNDEGNLKLADFGLGRKIRFESYFTYKVVTLWYRAP